MTPTTPTPPFTFSPSVSGLNISAKAYLSTHPHIARLMTGTVVFSSASPSSSSPAQILLLRRAASDSYPLKWEIPGGSVDSTDSTLLAAAARELVEEAALQVSRFLAPVTMVDEKAYPVTEEVRLTFGVAPEDEDDVVEADGLAVSFMESGKRWGKATVLAEVVDDAAVKTDPKEHDAWRWVSEEQARDCVFEDGERIEWVSDGVRRTVLEAFRLRKCGEA